jgi:D-alanine-D-alanine ligase
MDTYLDKAVVLTGGWGPERDENLAGGAAVCEALALLGRPVELVDIASPRDLRHLDTLDAAFAFLAHTEELPTIPILGFYRISHSGPDNWSSAVASYDKVVAYALSSSAGIPVPPGRELRAGSLAETADNGDNLANIVKPRRGGSSLGVSIVKTSKDLARAVNAAADYDSTILVETFLDGEEISVAAFGETVYSIVAVEPQKSPIFDYEAKRTLAVRYTAVTRTVSLGTSERLREWTRELARLLDVTSFWRADYRSDGRCLHVMDINLLPYLGGISGGLVETMCKDNEETYSEFLARLEAVNRHESA